MKKIRLVLSVCLIVLILASMTSCDLFSKGTKDSQTEQEKAFVPTSAIELWEKIDRTMDALKSYQCENKIEFVSFYDGQEIKINSKTIISELSSKDEYAYLEESETTIESSERAVVENTSSLEAFYNGKMYVANKDSSNEQKIMSEITAEKYKDTKENAFLMDEDFDFSACTNSDFSKNEDGSWKVEFSGYTKKSFDAFLKSMQLKEEDFGADIDDMQITATCNSKFYATTLEIKFVFDDDASVKPKFDCKGTYSKINEAKIDTAKINDADYKLVHDVYILDTLQTNLDDYIAADKGAFTSKLQSKITLDSTQKTGEENHNFEYGVENGGFYYSDQVTSKDANYNTSYKNGTQTISYAGEKLNNSLNEIDAKAVVLTYMGYGNYDKISVNSITKQSDGVYKITLSIGDKASFDGVIDPAYDSKVTSSSQEMLVTFSGEKLKKIVTNVSISGTITDGINTANLTVDTTYTVVFNSILTNPEQDV